MVVSARHRQSTEVYSEEVYEQLAQRCVAALRATEEMSSVVLCGSLVKSDIVPGWSDLDIIAFIHHSADCQAALQKTRSALFDARGSIRIGLGVDLVCEDQFESTNKICGKPLAMTPEVAAYGETAFGRDPFRSFHYDETVEEQIDHECPVIVAAQVHDWRRAFLAHRPGGLIEWSAYCVKAALKLMKLEAGPNLEAPFTHHGTLEKLTVRCPNHPALFGFVEAVEMRRDWLKYMNNPQLLEARMSVLCEILAKYPISGLQNALAESPRGAEE